MHDDGLKIDVIVIACLQLQRDGGASETGSWARDRKLPGKRRRAFFFGAAVQVQQGQAN